MERPPTAEEGELSPEEAPGTVEESSMSPEEMEEDLSPPPVPQNIIDELPPQPEVEEHVVGDAPPPSDPGSSAESAQEAPRAEGLRGRRSVTATPAARRAAEELGVDIFEVEGTGRDGRITVQDVRRTAEQERS